MENSKATVNIYDYGKAKSPGKKALEFISYLLGKIIFLAIIVFIGFCVYKYLDKTATKELDDMAVNATKNLYEYIQKNPVDDHYILEFPDVNNIVSSNGKINNSLGLDLNTFEEGFILMNKDGSYSFRLKYNGYCLKKDASSKKYNVTIILPCNTKLD